jgi:hypothetical protein
MLFPYPKVIPQSANIVIKIKNKQRVVPIIRPATNVVRLDNVPVIRPATNVGIQKPIVPIIRPATNDNLYIRQPTNGPISMEY